LFSLRKVRTRHIQEEINFSLRRLSKFMRMKVLLYSQRMKFLH
jgi:hypothetical protein